VDRRFKLDPRGGGPVANKQRRRRRATCPGSDAAAAPEERRSVAITVVWMLATLATVGAVAGSALVYSLTTALRPADPGLLQIVPGLLLLVGCCTGTLTLAVTPLVYRFRSDPPPRAIAVGAVLIAVAPWLVLGVLLLRDV
jgi:uncharacterized membrane protein